MSFGRYQFLPWARRGIGKHIKDTDTLGTADGNQDERAELSLSVRLSTGATQNRTLSLVGPGDVLGVSDRSMVRTEPRAGVTNYGPNLLPYVEFYDEDFPFRYTPAAAANNSRHHRPWLMLVVLKEDEFVDTDRRTPLRSILLIDDSPLPPADELHLWAHVHSNLPHEESDLEEFIDGLEEDAASDPDGLYSRILCPRRLEPATRYHAFLVPTYETGRRAGLGQPTAGLKAQTPAWPGQALELPVYYRWDFRTGQNFDFEHLVKQLEPRVMDERVGIRDMDCSRPAFVRANGAGEVRPVQPPVLTLGGALMAPNASVPDFPPSTQAQPFLSDLEELVNLNRLQVENPNEDPIVSVPFYGMHHAERRDRFRRGGRRPPDFEPNAERWYNELNMDPGQRVPAGFGKRVVQENQDRFMDIAWGQLGNVIAANRKARMARLAELAVGRVYEKTIATKSREAYLAGTKALATRIRVGNKTVFKAVNDSLIANASIDGGFRRVARVNGGISKRLNKRENAADFSYASLLKDTNKRNGISAELPDAFKVIPKLRRVRSYSSPSTAAGVKVWSAESNLSDAFLYNRPEFAGGLPDINNWTRRFSVDVIRESATPGVSGLRGLTTGRGARPFAGSPSAVTDPRLSLPGSTTFTTIDDRVITLVNTTRADNRDTTAVHNASVRKAYADANKRIGFRQVETAASVLNAAQTQRVVDDMINPAHAYKRLFERVFEAPPGTVKPRDEALLPVMAYPDIHDPMYKHLVEVDSEFLLPNLSLIPNNTLSILKTNQKFIEAYMVGLNYEMGRELMWQEYPTDRRGSYFRQFWDVKGLVTPASSSEDAEALKDIKPIHTWKTTSRLGTHNARDPAGDTEQLVFVIRGDLLKKFPNTVIYAQKAIDDPDSDDREDFVIRHGDMTDAQIDKEIRWPLYQAEISPDIKLLGFDLTIAEASGEENTPGFGNDRRGWYFVLAEVPGEPQFGMDIKFQPNTPGNVTWNDLSWENFPNPEAFIRAGRSPDFSAPPPESGVWGSDSANMAAILLQRPVMVAIHAREMLQSNVDPELDFMAPTTLFSFMKDITAVNPR